jgi:hypothetical protein
VAQDVGLEFTSQYCKKQKQDFIKGKGKALQKAMVGPFGQVDQVGWRSRKNRAGYLFRGVINHDSLWVGKDLVICTSVIDSLYTLKLALRYFNFAHGVCSMFVFFI